MSKYLTTPEVVLLIQLIAIFGFLFLAAYTMYAYLKMKYKTTLYISLAFTVIAISIVFNITIVPLVEENFGEAGIIEAIFESIQFLAAFLFFYGL
ncbi:MAG TPA: hypothetical protein VGB37_15640, partial [Candidatus Lokiarchaeia archaeon]